MRTRGTGTWSNLIRVAAVSLAIAGCTVTNHQQEQYLISPDASAGQSDLCQTPTDVEMNTINGYAEELIHSYNVHYKNENDALKDAGNTSSLWEYAVFDMDLVNPKHKYITQQINEVKKKQKFFEKQLANGHLYLYHIVNELKSRDMPLELAVIPIIESNFNPHAVSHSGARGIWQFVPITARNFKLKKDSTYDMRRDVIASTDAALTYFNYLYRIFNDWNLAIAAYNLGEGTVMKAIRVNKSLNRPTDLWSLPLPRSGVNYVEKLHAYTDLLRNAKQNKLKFPDMPYRPVFKKTHITPGTSLKKLSERTGISVERLRKLNPGFTSDTKPTTLVNYALIPVNDMDLRENYTLEKVKNPPKETYRTHAIAANIKAEKQAYEQLLAQTENLGCGNGSEITRKEAEISVPGDKIPTDGDSRPMLASADTSSKVKTAGKASRAKTASATNTAKSSGKAKSGTARKPAAAKTSGSKKTVKSGKATQTKKSGKQKKNTAGKK
ncbi:MAG: transglycosylase SLT domain-containing protein [Ruminobacter sp.]|nr:transglycosylase SLT domain-containing protein [Ruminobacter sp.]